MKVPPFVTKANDWLFGPTTGHTMALLRIFFGAFGVLNFLILSVGFDDFFSERGFVPLELSRYDLGTESRLNVLAQVSDYNVTLAVYIITALAALFTCLGLFTRVSQVIFAIGVVSLHHRNIHILHGGDTVVRQMAILLAVMPSNRVWSVDAWLAAKRNKPFDANGLVSIWPVRVASIQVAIVYFTTAWHKWNGDFWRDGTAVWYPMHLNEFDKFYLPEWMFTEPFVKISTYGTLFVEVALGTLVFFRPFRKWVLISGILMHAYIEYSMNIPLFAWLMVASYVSFYEGFEVRGFFEHVKRTRGRFWMKEVPDSVSSELLSKT